jgi:hypothetical protein
MLLSVITLVAYIIRIATIIYAGSILLEVILGTILFSTYFFSYFFSDFFSRNLLNF